MAAEKEWKRIRKWLPKEYIWEVQKAGKKNKKRRASEEMIMRKREKIEKKREKRKREEEGIITGKMCLGEEW